MRHAASTFSVASFLPATLTPGPGEVTTGLPTGVAVMEKTFHGEIEGRSTTIFVAAFDHDRGVGTYVALESFTGSVHGVDGAFNFVHSASTSGPDRTDEHFAIVPASATGGLEGLRGSGGLTVEDDGTHRVWLDYELG